MMLPWVMMTPLGLLVEPDVYCSHPGVWAARGSSCQARARESSVSSRQMIRMLSAKRTRPANSSTALRRRAEVTKTCEPESSTMRARRLNVRAMRARPGGVMGTAMARAYRQPKKAAMNSRPGGSISRTGRPSPWPVACMAAAMARARMSRRLYEQSSAFSAFPSGRKLSAGESGWLRAFLRMPSMMETKASSPVLHVVPGHCVAMFPPFLGGPEQRASRGYGGQDSTGLRSCGPAAGTCAGERGRYAVAGCLLWQRALKCSAGCRHRACRTAGSSAGRRQGGITGHIAGEDGGGLAGGVGGLWIRHIEKEFQSQ